MADCHDDLLLGVQHQRERGRADPFGEFWLPQLRAGGVVLQVLPVYTERQFVGEAALRRALQVIETARWLADLHRDDVMLVTTSGELHDAQDSGRIALVLAFEGMEPVGSDIDLIDTFWRLGVRAASLTWNRRTMFADGAGEAATGAGLSSLGEAALSRMERLGMILDVSHLSDAGFEHVRRIARRPFIASHSSCRAVHEHPRNLSDDMLRAIADVGGFAGMNAFGAFCGADPTIEDFVSHVEHAVSIVGADHVALGLDFVADLFEGLDPVLEGALVDAGHLRLIDGLRRPSDLAALGPRLEDRLGADDAGRVSSGTMVKTLSRLLPA
jgi:membrane dipeptidase